MKSDALFHPHCQAPWDEVGDGENSCHQFCSTGWAWSHGAASCLLLQKGAGAGPHHHPWETHRPSDPLQSHKKNGKTYIEAKRCSLTLPSAFLQLGWTARREAELRSSTPWQLGLTSPTVKPPDPPREVVPGSRGRCAVTRTQLLEILVSAASGVFKRGPGAWRDIGRRTLNCTKLISPCCGPDCQMNKWHQNYLIIYLFIFIFFNAQAYTLDPLNYKVIVEPY